MTSPIRLVQSYPNQKLEFVQEIVTKEVLDLDICTQQSAVVRKLFRSCVFAGDVLFGPAESKVFVTLQRII